MVCYFGKRHTATHERSTYEKLICKNWKFDPKVLLGTQILTKKWNFQLDISISKEIMSVFAYVLFIHKKSCPNDMKIQYAEKCSNIHVISKFELFD